MMNLNNATAVNEALKMWRRIAQARYGSEVVYWYPSRRHIELDDEASEVLRAEGQNSLSWGPAVLAKAKDPLEAVEAVES